MMTRASKGSKTRQPMQTTLGKSPVCYEDEESIDLSHVRKPIDTSIFGLKQVLSLFETGTDEVRRYVAYECDVMYECRMCRTIFRSLANFVLHKRNYCRDRYNPNDHTNCRNSCQENHFNIIEENSDGEKHASSCDEKTNEHQPKKPSKQIKKGISSVLQHLLQKQESSLITESVLNENINYEDTCTGNTERKNNVVLEHIDSNDAAVFQTMFHNMVTEHKKMEFMKSEVMEIHGILDSDEAVIGPNGKIMEFETEKKNEKQNIPKAFLVCRICNQKFSTKKTLTNHIRYKHNNTRIVYPCTECKDTFANAWCVFRHLYKVHRKTTSQIRKLRDQIHSSAIRQDELNSIKEESDTLSTESAFSSNVQEKMDQQWIDDFEGANDIQMCGGCGKRFERKAALHSHSQLCTKRIAMCNSIKESNYKQSQNEEKPSGKTYASKSLNSIDCIKGSERRKPVILLRRRHNIPNKTDDQIKEEIQSVSPPAKNDRNPENNNSDTPLNCSIKSISSNKASNEDCVSSYSSSDDVIYVDTYFKNKEFKADIVDLEKESDILDTSFESSSNSSVILCDTENIEDIDTRKQHGTVIKSKETSDVLDVEQDCCSPVFNLNPNDIADMIGISYGSESNEYVLPASSQLSDTTEFKKSDVNIDNHRVKQEADIKPSSVKCSLPTQGDILNEKNNNTTQSSKGMGLLGGNNTEIQKIFEDNKNKCNTLTLSIEEALRKVDSICDYRSKNSKSVEIVCDNNETKKRKRTFSVDDTNNHKLAKSSNTCCESATQEVEMGLKTKALRYTDITELACLPCELIFLSSDHLFRHMAVHFNWFCYQCSKCEFMSYDKESCTEHIRAPCCGMVLPIPNWKTVDISTDFVFLNDITHVGIDLQKSLKYFNKILPEESNKVTTENSESVIRDDVKEISELQSAVNSDNKADVDQDAQDPSVRKMVMEVIFGTDFHVKKEHDRPIRLQETPAVTPKVVDNQRPVRNRVSKVQKDFFYDMNHLLKPKLNSEVIVPKKIQNTGDKQKTVVSVTSKSVKCKTNSNLKVVNSVNKSQTKSKEDDEASITSSKPVRVYSKKNKAESSHTSMESFDENSSGSSTVKSPEDDVNASVRSSVKNKYLFSGDFKL